MEDLRDYTVKSPVRYGRKEYDVGETVSMPTALAAPLVALGRLIDAKAGDATSTGFTKEQVEKMGEEYVARVKDDLEATQKLRDEAAADLEAATKLRADAAADLEAAKAERAEAAADLKKAEGERKAAEKAAKK